MRVFAYFLRVQKVGRPSGRNLARTRGGASLPPPAGGEIPGDPGAQPPQGRPFRRCARKNFIKIVRKIIDTGRRL